MSETSPGTAPVPDQKAAATATDPAPAPTRARYIVLGGLCAASALAYFTRNGVAAAESTIRLDLGLSKEQSGMIMSAFFLPYALCQLPAAMLTQRIGTRWALPLYGILWSLATAGMALGQSLLMIASRACMGIAQAGLVPAGVTSLACWFPRTAQATASGAFSGFMSVGGIIAAPLTAYLVVTTGWRWMFVLYALPGILWALWFATWYRNRPQDHPAVNIHEQNLITEGAPETITTTSAAASSSSSVKAPTVKWKQLLVRPALHLLCLQQFCRAAGYIFFSTWFATYLQEARGVTIIKSAFLTTLPLLADFSGSMLGGIVSDKLLHRTRSERLARQGLCVIALILCAAFIFSAWTIAHPTAAVIIISLGMFCAAVANPCLNATVISLSGPHTATVSAITNMCGNLGAAVFPISVPWLLHQAGGWNAVLISFGTLYLIAATSWFLIKPGYTIYKDQAAETEA